jgi:hypothetical protein
MFAILHCCRRQTGALFIALFYAVNDEGTQEGKHSVTKYRYGITKYNDWGL